MPTAADDQTGAGYGVARRNCGTALAVTPASMYKDNSVAVVIPAYNEESFVGDVVRSLPVFVDRAYVVDDCSTDETWQEIQLAVTHVNATREGLVDDQFAEAIQHEENTGVGGAIKTGYNRARQDGMDITAVMNGDGQMDPEILHRIIDPVAEGRADYAKGNRLLSRDHMDGMSRWRQFGNGLLTFLTKVSSGYWKTMDPQNGYTAISERALNRLDVDELYDDYGFCNDILVRLNARSMRVADVEMEAVYGEETSDITYRHFIPAVFTLLLRGFLWRLKTRYLVFDFHPLVLLYALGTVGVTGSVAHAGFTLVRAVPGARLLLAFVAFLVSSFSLVLAMTFDLSNSEHLEVQVFADETPEYREHEPDREGVPARPMRTD
jgi:glycosyltransferase involved in cell wall biosynthesis